MSYVIGITGLSGAGKDTLARAMQYRLSQWGVSAALAGFADPIREVCKATGILDPYNRGLKEVQQTVHLDTFCDGLQHAIDGLRPYLNSNDRSDLYDLMVQHTEQFRSPPVGSSYSQYIHISPRQFMQVLGTEAGQTIRKKLWVEIAHARWDNGADVTLVTDFRFPHEAEALYEIITVVRPGLPPVAGHVSEEMATYLSGSIVPVYLDLDNHYVLNAWDVDWLARSAYTLADNFAKGLNDC